MGLDLLVALYAVVQGHRAGRIDQAAGIVPGQADDAPQAALADAALLLEQALAQLFGRRADGSGLGQDAAGFPRGIKGALSIGQEQAAAAARRADGCAARRGSGGRGSRDDARTGAPAPELPMRAGRAA